MNKRTYESIKKLMDYIQWRESKPKINSIEFYGKKSIHSNMGKRAYNILTKRQFGVDRFKIPWGVTTMFKTPYIDPYMLKKVVQLIDDFYKWEKYKKLQAINDYL